MLPLLRTWSKGGGSPGEWKVTKKKVPPTGNLEKKNKRGQELGMNFEREKNKFGGTGGKKALESSFSRREKNKT